MRTETTNPIIQRFLKKQDDISHARGQTFEFFKAKEVYIKELEIKQLEMKVMQENEQIKEAWPPETENKVPENKSCCVIL